MSLLGKIRYRIYSMINMDVAFRKEKFIREGGRIGVDCEVFPDVEFGSEPYLITIGNHVRIANGVRFMTHDGGAWVLRNLGLENADIFGTIEVGDNVHIGWNAIIMPNVSIGSNVVIGAGAVVTKNIPDNSVAVGVPAKVIESIDEYYMKAQSKSVPTKSLSYAAKKDYLMKKYGKGNVEA